MKNNIANLAPPSPANKDCTHNIFDKVLSSTMIIALSPLMAINSLSALISRQPIYTQVTKIDALGQSVSMSYFTLGICKNSALLLNIFTGKLSFCGIPTTHLLTDKVRARVNNSYSCKPGLFSLFDLHRRTGLVTNDAEQLLLKQLNSSTFSNALLLAKSILCNCLYATTNNELVKSKQISVFGINLHNLTMQEAVDWTTAGKLAQTSSDKTTTKLSSASETKNPAKIGFFVNVNSINLCLAQAKFHRTLQQADMLLADGSGMRLAAKSAGYLLKDNTNGTDLLPYLCSSCIKQSKSIYFFGSKPGVAAKAASKLQKQFPGLRIAGTQHGFIKPEQMNEQIEKINQSGCDILLVAMGSPFQEQWLLAHKQQLHCHTALAVGGLFDFYSGDIARAPLWLRELGLEWCWRLWQEPITKFKRYVFGNPLFLFRIYVLGLASKGVKS